MGTIHDSFTDGPTDEERRSMPPGHFPSVSIMDTAKEAAITMRRGGGVGYDISTLRPAGDVIHGVQGITDGPLAFAPIFDATCRATSSAGNRRGAQMLVMRIDHPDIETYIRAKQTSFDVPYEYRPLRGFNMSIAVTDEFMSCLEHQKSFPLRFNGRVYREIDPVALWEMIMRGTYDYSDPGVLFIDTINRMNNLRYCETIAATNPCGEQPLPPYGACLLGSINATKYVTESRVFNYEMLAYDVPYFVRAMDNVVDRSRYPLPQQRQEAQRKRRMGIGVTGMANAIEAMGHPYGTEEYLAAQDVILEHLNHFCYQASVELAREKGPFPMFDAEQYCESPFIRSLDPDLQADIKKYGIRNSHLTSQAPNGTISLVANNVSSSLEPVFSPYQERRVQTLNGEKLIRLKDYGMEYFGTTPKMAREVTPAEHVAVICRAQRYVDSAISKTCNCPEEIMYDDFKHLYRNAYEGGAKGITTYRPNGAHPDVIREITAEDAEAEGICRLDENGQRVGVCAD
jgi:ribonucleoside-diphosphate reductase alpha chain